MGYALTAAEHLWEFASDYGDSMCDNTGPHVLCLGVSLLLACAPNPAAIVCGIANILGKMVSYGILFAVTLAYESIDHIYEIATLGEHSCCLMSHISLTN